MSIGYTYPSVMAWNASQGHIYSSWRSNPRYGLLRESGVEANKMLHRSPRLGLRPWPWLISPKAAALRGVPYHTL